MVDELTERTADVPALFGMPAEGERSHQEQMMAPFLFGAIFVHVIFLDNSKTDTTPNREERNETYAQFSSFGDIIRWCNDVKCAVDVRFNSRKDDFKHILVIISSDQQVVATEEEINKLNECIGVSPHGDFKPFYACYFMDERLDNGKSKLLVPSKFAWDMQVSRLLLAFLLSQNASGVEALHKIPGVKVWRAADCVYSVNQDDIANELKIALEDAHIELLNQTGKEEEFCGKLVQNVKSPERFICRLESKWSEGDGSVLSFWQASAASGKSFIKSLPSMFHTWIDFHVGAYCRDVSSFNHWKAGFEKLKKERLIWSRKHQTEDYTGAVNEFFRNVKTKPGILNYFANTISANGSAQTSENGQLWAEIAAAEERRKRFLKTVGDNSVEFKKAQDYYVGRGPAVLVMMATTVFLGWVIWRVFSICGVGILTILLLASMVFIGSMAAGLVIILMHNFTGNRAAVEIADEIAEVDKCMRERDEKVREMFLHGIETRDSLSLQHVRFKTLQLVNRILSILQEEFKPGLNIQFGKNAKPQGISSDIELPADSDHVRDNFLHCTRQQKGTFRAKLKKGDFENKMKEFVSGDNSENADFSFVAAWQEVTSRDNLNAGYYPAKVSVAKIRSFLKCFREHVENEYLCVDGVTERIDKFFQEFRSFCESNYYDNTNFLSAPWTDDRDGKVEYLFHQPGLVNQPFDQGKNSGDKMKISPSEQLKNTGIVALYYQELPARFALKEFPGKKTVYKQLVLRKVDSSVNKGKA